MDLVICVFGCDTIDKYKDQILKINETWGKQAGLHANVQLLFFLGEEVVLEGPQYIHLKGVTNDYKSCSYKQFLGLKYIYEKCKSKFVISVGSDTYINIPKLLKYISRYNHQENLYIGGHGCHRNILGTSVYFHSGGPGFVISWECLRLLYPKLEGIVDEWLDICSRNNSSNLEGACDVIMAYHAQLPYLNSQIIKTNDLSMIHCNHRGVPCHPNMIDMRNIVSCHCMSPEDFDEFTDILNQNNFFV